jgi:two-component system response regulator FlrC
MGYIRAAHGGTLLLDEISDLPPEIQAKLLRTLQEGEVVPVGESRPGRVDVRFIAASQVRLQAAVRAGRFRADLWARLNGYTIRLPRLCERVEEIPSLFARMLADAGMPLVALEASLVEKICLHRWPLNLRELNSVARRVAAIHRGVPLLTARHLVALDPPDASAPMPLDVPAWSSRFERAFPPEQIQALQSALEQHGRSVKRAASALGISRTKAYRLLRAGRRRERAEHIGGTVGQRASASRHRNDESNP